MIERIGFIAGAVFGLLGLIAALSMLFALPVWWLWNALFPDIFGLPPISFMQAWGLNIMAGCLLNKPTSVSAKS